MDLALVPTVVAEAALMWSYSKLITLLLHAMKYLTYTAEAQHVCCTPYMSCSIPRCNITCRSEPDKTL